MNIARLGSDVTLLVDEGMLSTELITQAVDLAIELGSCHTLTVIVSAADAKSDVFGSRWEEGLQDEDAPGHPKGGPARRDCRPT